MNLSDEEFLSLSGQMSGRDVKIASLENKVKQLEGDLLVAKLTRCLTLCEASDKPRRAARKPRRADGSPPSLEHKSDGSCRVLTQTIVPSPRKGGDFFCIWLINHPPWLIPMKRHR